MIRLENVTFSFKDDKDVLIKDLSFSISKGECVALTGPSGIGKSTIANIIAGFVKPCLGRVFVEDIDNTGTPSKRVILLSQESDLFPWQTVRQHIMFVLRHVNFADAKTAEAKMKELLQLVNLQEFEGKFPFQLSGGMKKRLSLARALAIAPDLLILDEIFSSLDMELKKVLYEDLKKIWGAKKTTILLLSHDQEEVRFLCKRNIVLKPNRPTGIERIEDYSL